MNVPDSPAALTPAYFSDLLSKPDTPVVVSEAQQEPVGVGAGMMSIVRRVHLTYREGTGPASVIVKLPTEILQNREIAVQFDNFRREVEFYRQAAGGTPMRTPQTYLAETDGPDNFILVLEDLGDWDLGDQVAGTTLPRARTIMQALADLHGAFWNQVDDGDWEWLPNNYPSVMSEGLSAGTEASWDSFIDLFADELTPALSNAKSAYMAGLAGAQNWMNSTPRTIIHGDYRMDNLFFRESGGDIEVACCDFQAPVRGRGIQELAYFMSGSIDTEMRREHEQDLIRLWLDTLASRHGVTDYSFDEAFYDYRVGILMMWTYVVIVGGGMAAENERGDNWVSAMVSRSIAAMEDHDCLSLLDRFQTSP